MRRRRRALGYGGVAAVARATGLSRGTIGRGLKDLDQPRCPGAGCGATAVGGALRATDPTLLEDLRRLVEPATMGDPMRPLLWVSKSHAKLAAALAGDGPQGRPNTVPKLLRQLDYRRQVNRKTQDGRQHPDRDAQFEHINAQVRAFQAADQPVISVDTKKKELVGNYKNSGSDYRPAGQPAAVKVHDFVDKDTRQSDPLRRLRHRRQYAAA